MFPILDFFSFQLCSRTGQDVTLSEKKLDYRLTASQKYAMPATWLKVIVFRFKNRASLFLDICTLKVPSFIYLCRLVETLQTIKVSVFQNFEDFCIETFIQIH